VDVSTDLANCGCIYRFWQIVDVATDLANCGCSYRFGKLWM